MQNYAAEQVASGCRAEFESFAAADSIVKRLCESGKCSFKYTDASGNPAELCFEAGTDVYAEGSKVCAVIYKKPRADK